MDDKNLQAAAEKIKILYKHSRVLLFGSRSGNKARPDSDVDLCVIVENPAQRLLEISRTIRKEIYPVLRSPVDILVYDKQTFNERSAFPLTMEAEISEYAREL